MDEFDLQGIMGSSSSAADAFEDLQDDFDRDSSSQHWAPDPTTSVPDTDMQRLRQELHLKARRIKRTFKQHQASSAAAAADAAEEAAAAAGQAPEPAGPAAAVHEQLESIRTMIRANADRWGTTQQSPAEIAQQIADSNKAAGGGSGGADGEGSDDEGEGGEEEPLSLNPGEERYADPSAVAADLREMDEIFEVLAKVRLRGGPLGVGGACCACRHSGGWAMSPLSGLVSDRVIGSAAADVHVCGPPKTSMN